MKNFHPTGNCPVRDVLSRLGDKWSMLVLITLSANGTMRFSDIHKTIADVSQRMLTVTLRTLESDGLIERKVYAEVPPRVEYCLTERGLSLIPHIQGLVDWALQQMSGIMESRVLHTSWLALALIYQWAFSARISASDRWVNLLSIQARTSNVFKSWRSYLSCSIFWMSFWYCSQRLFLAFSYDGSG